MADMSIKPQGPFRKSSLQLYQEGNYTATDPTVTQSERHIANNSKAMEDRAHLQQLGAEVQKAVDVHARMGDVNTYKALQTNLRRLQVASSNPSDTLFTFRTQVIENIAIGYLLEMGVLEALVERKGATATASDLAAATGKDEFAIARLMRVASALLFIDEIGPSTYTANDLTTMLIRPGWKGAIRWAEPFYPMAADIHRFHTHVNLQGDGSSTSAFQFTHDKDIWALLKQDPELRQNFDLWMRERRLHEENSWDVRFPPLRQLRAHELKTGTEDVLLVDIASGIGHQAMDFRAQFGELPGRVVAQDLFMPETNGAGPKKEGGVEMMKHDFFTPQPVEGARFYYIRNAFHNWPDSKAAEILANLVPAMDPEYSSLLIDDFVLPTQGAQLRGAVEDILMMVTTNALERTLEQYRHLLENAGLEIVRYFAVGQNEEAVIEARVRKERRVGYA